MSGEPPEKCLVAENYLDALKQLAIETIKATAANGVLISNSRLAYIMFRWRELAEDDGASVKSWTGAQLANDKAVAYFSKAFTRESWSQGMGMDGLGDRVAMRHTTAGVDRLGLILDVEMFRARVETLDASGNLTAPYSEWVDTFLEAWRRRNRGEQD